MITVYWKTDGGGNTHERTTSRQAAIERLEKLHRRRMEAIAYEDDCHDPCGGVEKKPPGFFDTAPRLQWFLWYDLSMGKDTKD